MYARSAFNIDCPTLTQIITIQSPNPRVRRPGYRLDVETKRERYQRGRPLRLTIHTLRKHIQRQQTGLPPRYGTTLAPPLKGRLHILRRFCLTGLRKIERDVYSLLGTHGQTL